MYMERFMCACVCVNCVCVSMHFFACCCEVAVQNTLLLFSTALVSLIFIDYVQHGSAVYVRSYVISSVLINWYIVW